MAARHFLQIVGVDLPTTQLIFSRGLINENAAMSKVSLRVVFDTNAFTPDHFDLIAMGPLASLCRTGRITPVYGHVFLEETFRAYGLANKREDLVNRWIPFIASTVNRFCEDFLTIWHRELVQARGTRANIYMRLHAQRKLIDRLAQVPLDGTWRAWHMSMEAREVEDKKRAAQRETSKEIRQEVADWRKAVNYTPNKNGIVDYAQYLKTEIDHAGRAFIAAQIKCSNPLEVANRWSRSKRNFPYFTTFVENMLYIGYCAMTRPNDKIDLNAQADLDLMTHLLRAEVLVSNETGFLRKAFDDIWRPRGKAIFTSQEFVSLIAKL
ncbi:hypothetical protein [Variovorax guangxiensis]|uniref:Uncharacterized protein n=1 Tax=Variovorax guangxiensis TaxID=1775474 RepID=A0A840FZJ8_9BURK|nr:hypothetical protein [Variovorax guangxiensis]MBB4224900.1 hypothetical protein [Variovorax guangxiensis]